LISDVPFTVVGITPERFESTASPVIPRMYATWQALRLPPAISPRGLMIGRLAARATLRTAQADFARVAAQLRREKNQPVSVAVYAGTTNLPGLQRVFSIFAALFIKFHGLRHTVATLMLSAGVPAHMVQRRLGHAKIEMTLGIYAHALPSMQQDAAAKLAALLHG
jgi:hypothetical protein